MKQHGTDTVREQAAAWFARVQDAPRDAGLQKQLRAWLASDERHRQEYQHLSRVWQAANFIPRQRLEALCQPDRVQQLPRRRFMRQALAASVAVLALGLGWGGWHYQQLNHQASVQTASMSAARSNCRMARNWSSMAVHSCRSSSALASGISA